MKKELQKPINFLLSNSKCKHTHYLLIVINMIWYEKNENLDLSVWTNETTY